MVEDLLFERGIEICHKTVELWWNRFGPRFAAFAYRKASLTAFGELDSALEGTGRLAPQENAAVRPRAAASALNSARKRHQAGHVAYLEQPDAQS